MDLIWSSKNAQGVATRHHDATGHTTWVEISMSIKYGDGSRTIGLAQKPQPAAEK